MSISGPAFQLRLAQTCRILAVPRRAPVVSAFAGDDADWEHTLELATSFLERDEPRTVVGVDMLDAPSNDDDEEPSTLAFDIASFLEDRPTRVVPLGSLVALHDDVA